MADLIGSPQRNERAQLLLVAGFVLAVTFVALALILNSAIFTENLATRGESVGGSGPIEVQDEVGDGVGELLEYVNAHNNTAREYPVSNLSSALDRYSNFSGRHYGDSGELVVTDYHDVTNGTRIIHSDRTASFTNRTGYADWTPVESSNQIRAFGFNVSRTDLPDVSQCPSSSSCFRANVTNAASPTSEWGVALSQNSTHIIVQSYTDSGLLGSCSVEAETANVNVSSARVGNRTCQSLRFAQGVSSPYNLTFENGNVISGRYSLVASNESIVTLETGAGGVFDPPDSSTSPRATYAVYSVDVDVLYITDRTEFESILRVAPGERR